MTNQYDGKSSGQYRPEGAGDEDDIVGSLGDTGSEIPLDRITRVVANHFGCPAYINLIDGSSERCISSSTGRIHMMGLDLSICVQVVRTGKPTTVADLQADPRLSKHPFVQGRANWRSYAGVPVRVNGKIEGVLCVIDTEPREFTDYDLDVLSRFGDVTAEVLRNQLKADTEFRLPAVTRVMLDALPDATIVLSEAGTIIFRNEAADWDFVESEDADWSNLWPASVHPAALSALDRALEHGEAQFEAHITADETGSEFHRWYDVRLKRCEIEGRVMVLATARDVALRRMVETALIENEVRWRETVNALPEALMIIDDRGEIQYVNAAAVHLLDADRASAVLGHHASEFMPAFNGIAEADKHSETTIRLPAGALRRVVVRSQPTRGWGNGRMQLLLSPIGDREAA